MSIRFIHLLKKRKETALKQINSTFQIKVKQMNRHCIFRRHLHSTVKKGTQSIRKINDIHTAEYYFENGLRKVKPYYFDFKGYAKDRMLGYTLLDVFKREYRGRTENYYSHAIEKGLITINNQLSSPDTMIKRQDLISHKVHRHEPPVTDQPINIVYEDEGLFVVNKPGSIPVHPSGRYRHNTVVHILKKELGYDRLFPTHRLDRITSGLNLIAKNSKRADMIEKEMRAGDIQKEYICRVAGEFPLHEVICNEPIKQLAHLVALNYVHPQGKPAVTHFERISYNGQTSVVKCKPLTGRTHQIRVHLRYLGFPIANDPIYGYSTLWSDQFQTLDTQSIIDTMIATAPYDYMDDDPLNKTGFPRCEKCNVPMTPHDPKREELSLWLHAYRYSGKTWDYQAPWPEWADDLFKHDEPVIPASI